MIRKHLSGDAITGHNTRKPGHVYKPYLASGEQHPAVDVDIGTRDESGVIAG